MQTLAVSSAFLDLRVYSPLTHSKRVRRPRQYLDDSRIMHRNCQRLLAYDASFIQPSHWQIRLRIRRKRDEEQSGI